MLPRRFLTVIILAIVAVILLVTSFSNSSARSVSVPTVAELSRNAKQAAEAISITGHNLPKLYNPFSSTAHEPPEQADSNNGGTKWYSDLKWLYPFSSEATLDDQRVLLPPLPTRVPIYTFYQPSDDPAVIEAEHKLLLTWRRAWWAKGFKPIVLGHAEAVKSPYYEQVQRLKLNPALNAEAERWLAWEHMGGSILSSWLTLPMTDFEDPLMAFLRRGQFEVLFKFQGLSNGLFCGKASKVTAAIKEFVSNKQVASSRSFLDLLAPTTYDMVSSENAIAYYDMETITFQYDKIREELSRSQVNGLGMLQQLINAHLHSTWQGSFPDGISVLKPHPEHMSGVIAHSLRLARDLITCPASPIPSSCPPNNLRCKPCSDISSDLHCTTPPTFRNSSTTFVIGTVPHPYTFTTLYHSRENVDVPFIRRDTTRDLWINATTAELLGTKLGGPQRLLLFKEAVASPFAIAHSIWVTAERAEAMQRDWLFGFELPSARSRELPPVRDNDPFVPTDSSRLAKDRMLLELAREHLQPGALNGPQQALMKSVESWNLADMEAWLFVQAFAVRRRTEREIWETEESKFAGAEIKETGRS